MPNCGLCPQFWAKVMLETVSFYQDNYISKGFNIKHKDIKTGGIWDKSMLETVFFVRITIYVKAFI